MYIELLIVAFFIYVMFNDYFQAIAELVSEQARAKRLENDKVEFGEEHEG